jgi:hypothetical protein
VKVFHFHIEVQGYVLALIAGILGLSDKGPSSITSFFFVYPKENHVGQEIYDSI